MPDLEQIQAKFRAAANDSRDGGKGGGDDSEVSSNSSATRCNGDTKEDELAEFETKEFPEHDSARDSANFDNISTSSSQDAAMGPPPPPHFTIPGPPPVIQVEGVPDTAESHQATTTPLNRREVELKNSATNTASSTHKQQQQQPITTDSTTTKPTPLSTVVSQNPIFFWILLVAAVVPLAYIIQLAFGTSKS